MTRIVKRKKRRNSIEPKYDKKINNLIENKNNNQDDYAVHSRETVVIDEVVSLLEGDVKQNKLNDHPHNPNPKSRYKPKPKPKPKYKPKHNNNQQPHSTDVKHRRFSLEENAKKVKRKLKKEKKKMEKEEKKRKQAQKVIEKLKELKETKKKAKWEARKGQIKKACKLGLSIGLIAVEIVLLCL